MKTKLLVVALCAFGIANLVNVTMSSAATLFVNNWPVTPTSATPSGGIGDLGELAYFLNGPSSFYGQSFTAPSIEPVIADQLTFAMENSGADDTGDAPVKFDILLVATGSQTAPTYVPLSDILFQSAPMILSNSPTFTGITVNLGHTLLEGGLSYLWVIDAYSDRNGVSGLASVGTKNGPSDETFYALNIATGGLPLSDLTISQAQPHPIDLAFEMMFTTVTPLPASLPLFATGLGVMGLFGWRRKRKDSAIATA